MPIEAQTETHRILDPQHQGMVVATFEHPRGWQAHSQVVWNFNDTSYPVAVYASTFNPNGTEALQFLPTESCFWVQGNVMYTPGQRYRGQTCLFPMSGLDALTRWAIPKYRGDRQNLRILYAQPVPNLAQMFRNDWLLSVPHEGVMARIGYEENGRSFEEEFYTCVMWHPPNGQQFNWGLINLCCFRAAQGELDAARQNLWRIVTSLRNNPEWGQVFATIIQQLHAQVRSFFGAVNAKLEAEKVQGQQLFEYRQWQANLNQQQFNARWESQERRAQQTGDVLAGRVSYEDPSNAYGNPHHDYGHHQYVWTNGRGEWIHSHEAGYNPNHDPNTLSRGPWSLARMAR
ncbi:MAG TPA: hypothetical protein VIW92_15160 [Thermoanaerobaculia bacterium]